MSLKRPLEADGTHNKRLRESRPPVIPINPLQRLDLYKKRQRWRQSHIYSAKISQVSKTRGNYRDISVQTDYVPTLQSHAVVNKSMAQKAAERRLAGVYSGQLTYEPQELQEHKVKFLEDKKSDPILQAKKVVQSDKVSVGPSAGFNFLDKVDLKIQDIADQSKTVQNTKTNGPIFGDSKPEIKPTTDLCNTKAETTPLVAAEKKDDSQPISFGSTTEKVHQKPAFSFGLATDNKETPAFSLGSAKKQDFAVPAKTDEKPAFNFVAPEKNNDKPSFSFAAPAKKDDKPSFSFGSTSSNKPASFGSNTEAKEDGKPTLSFGSTVPTNDKPSISSSLFTIPKTQPIASSSSSSLFGAKKNTDARDGNSDSEEQDQKRKRPTVAFNFGSKPQETKSDTFAFGTKLGETTAKAAAFSLGSGANEKKASKPLSFDFNAENKGSILPSFGAPADKKEPTPFMLGGAGEKKESAPFILADSGEKKENTPFAVGSEPLERKKPTPFAFGATTEKKEPTTFAFGSKTNDAKEPSPFSAGPASKEPTPFAFGTKQDDKKETTPFVFGSNIQPSSTFGKPDEHPPAFGAAQTTFNFGSSTPTFPKAASQSSQMFGASNAFGGDKPAGVFGQTTALNPATTNTNGFNFGGNAPSQNPASVFGSQPQNPTSAFGQSNVNGSSQFGSGAPSAFGGTPQPSAPQFNGQGGVNFNFAGSSAVDPSSVFGGINPGNSFATSTPAMASTPTPRVAGRKIAQHRPRRR